MKETVTIYRFVDAMRTSFPTAEIKHLETLFEYLQNLEEELETELELDPPALRDQFAYYRNEAEFLKDYDGYKSLKEAEANGAIIIRCDDGSFFIDAYSL